MRGEGKRTRYNNRPTRKRKTRTLMKTEAKGNIKKNRRKK